MKEKIIDITELCSQKHPIHFKIIGGSRFGHSFPIPEHLQNNIQLTGWVDYQDLHTHLENVDIGWIDLENVQNSINKNYVLPYTLFMFMYYLILHLVYK